MTGQHRPPPTVHNLRRRAHQFLQHYAAPGWETRIDGKPIWDIVLPPQLEALPWRRRFRVHARQEARRLADAALYDVCPAASQLAVLHGAALDETGYPAAVANAGHPDVIDTFGIIPPSPTGFLRWQDPIAVNERGAPITACHWGPLSSGGRDGVWMVWWSDTRALMHSYTRDADTAQQWTTISSDALIMIGPLWYDTGTLICPHNPAAEPGPGPAADAFARAVESAARPAGQAGPPAARDDLRHVAVHTTVATWALLNSNNPDVTHASQPPPQTEIAADQTAQLSPRPVTFATTCDNHPDPGGDPRST